MPIDTSSPAFQRYANFNQNQARSFKDKYGTTKKPKFRGLKKANAESAPNPKLSKPRLEQKAPVENESQPADAPGSNKGPTRADFNGTTFPENIFEEIEPLHEHGLFSELFGEAISSRVDEEAPPLPEYAESLSKIALEAQETALGKNDMVDQAFVLIQKPATTTGQTPYCASSEAITASDVSDPQEQANVAAVLSTATSRKKRTADEALAPSTRDASAGADLKLLARKRNCGVSRSVARNKAEKVVSASQASASSSAGDAAVASSSIANMTATPATDAGKDCSDISKSTDIDESLQQQPK